ncbi:uncharacterized protein LOC110006873 isoform X2 [Amborella trichopoda]|uniref:uncharacterized protein LOC110006873 isoform X2 n=1 Tax=Amborella trichopoda TaxID=13333 RepID=UPI0009BDDC25|nr:uncharacterized protein LOC110006873 isoform X2 [Amborella trichopoda]|eukprot:XP_020520303.1 uncharacterized protein LOC110006873 isoform X2 [Amborella trichopoda]
MAFRTGSRVEVSRDEKGGCKGAWFTASVAKMMGESKVMVKYDNLVSNDKKRPLVEITNIVNVRPLPPPRGFSVHEEVDAFCNDGWWAGVITKVMAEGPKYIVYLWDSEKEMIFEPNQLRVHQDFVDGHWIMPSSSKEEQSIKNEESIPLSNNYNVALVIREKDSSIEQEMEPLVEALPLKKCGSNIGTAKKLSLFPLSSISSKGLDKLDKENDDCILIKATDDLEKPSRKHGKRSQLDTLVTKDGPKRAKKREDNGKTSLVAPSAQAMPSQNREFEERMIDASKCHGAKKGGDNGSLCMVSPCSKVNPSQNSRIGKAKNQKGTKELEEENNSRKCGRRSQLDMPGLTLTNEGAKKEKKGKDDGNIVMFAPSSEAKTKTKVFGKRKTDEIKIKYHRVKKEKKGEDNGSLCMVSPCSEVKPGQNRKTKTQDSGEKMTDGVKCDEICVSIPQMRVLKRKRASNLAVLAGNNCRDVSLAAYSLVLQALYLQGDHKWGNEIFLAGLRAALAITNDEHMEELKRVTSYKFMTTTVS